MDRRRQRQPGEGGRGERVGRALARLLFVFVRVIIAGQGAPYGLGSSSGGVFVSNSISDSTSTTAPITTQKHASPLVDGRYNSK